MTEPRAGTWISVDGVEGAGKTTLTSVLAAGLHDAELVAEFGAGAVGRFLARAVIDHPHLISESSIGQSLVFLGEFWERYEARVRPVIDRGGVVLMDRGYLSKYAYQWAVMRPDIGADAADALLAPVFATLRPPDVTVLLKAPLPIVRRRLVERDGACDDERLAFIESAEEAFCNPPFTLPRRLVFDTSTASPVEIGRAVAEEVCRDGWSNES